MRTLSRLALFLEISPLLAFGCLGFLHPVGNPQKSHSLLVRMLDFQGTYWMRNAIPAPPPLLVTGLLISAILWWRHHFKSARAGTMVGIVLLGLWSFIMGIPLLVHVN